MRASIGAKIFGIAIALLLFMTAVFGLGLGMARQGAHHLTLVVDHYVPIYAAVSRRAGRRSSRPPIGWSPRTVIPP
jgi:hypothetical protein